MNPTQDLIVLGSFIAFIIAVVLRPDWAAAVAVRLLAFTLIVLKWLVVVGLVSGFCCCPQTYVVVGWTPASLLFGDEIYDRSLRELKLHRATVLAHENRAR
jgi:hypothetical protein